jgi:hypothetical protein
MQPPEGIVQTADVQTDGVLQAVDALLNRGAARRGGWGGA